MIDSLTIVLIITIAVLLSIIHTIVKYPKSVEAKEMPDTEKPTLPKLNVNKRHAKFSIVCASHDIVSTDYVKITDCDEQYHNYYCGVCKHGMVLHLK